AVAIGSAQRGASRASTGRTPRGVREAERESAQAGRRGLGASEQRSARGARAADGPPGSSVQRVVRAVEDAEHRQPILLVDVVEDVVVVDGEVVAAADALQQRGARWVGI